MTTITHGRPSAAMYLAYARYETPPWSRRSSSPPAGASSDAVSSASPTSARASAPPASARARAFARGSPSAPPDVAIASTTRGERRIASRGPCSTTR